MKTMAEAVDEAVEEIHKQYWRRQGRPDIVRAIEARKAGLVEHGLSEQEAAIFAAGWYDGWKAGKEEAK